jgi:hypothetical protein
MLKLALIVTDVIAIDALRPVAETTLVPIADRNFIFNLIMIVHFIATNLVEIVAIVVVVVVPGPVVGQFSVFPVLSCCCCSELC